MPESSELAKSNWQRGIKKHMVPSLPLLSCESSVSVKENLDKKKTKKYDWIGGQ